MLSFSLVQEVLTVEGRKRGGLVEMKRAKSRELREKLSSSFLLEIFTIALSPRSRSRYDASINKHKNTRI